MARSWPKSGEVVEVGFSSFGNPLRGVFTSVGGLGRNFVAVCSALEIVLWSLGFVWYVFPLAGEGV